MKKLYFMTFIVAAFVFVDVNAGTYLLFRFIIVSFVAQRFDYAGYFLAQDHESFIEGASPLAGSGVALNFKTRVLSRIRCLKLFTIGWDLGGEGKLKKW